MTSIDGQHQRAPGSIDGKFPEGMPEDMMSYWVEPSWQQRSADEFTMVKKVGEGTYGEVWRATSVEDNHVVALKHLKKEEDGLPITTLREIQLLQTLEHPNLVTLLDVVSSHQFLNLTHPMSLPRNFRGSCPGEKAVYLVFEFFPVDLEQVVRSNYDLSSDQAQLWAEQIFRALAYLHSQGVLHRDLKCANVLVSEDGFIKLADLGLARKALTRNRYTVEVVTRYYRAPEVLLLGTRRVYEQQMRLGTTHPNEYDCKIDVWAAGCMLAELLMKGNVLFPGVEEIEQYNRIIALCGEPNDAVWPNYSSYALIQYIYALNREKGIPQAKPTPRRLAHYLHSQGLSEQAIELLDKILVMNPQHRPSAEEVLKHPFFARHSITPARWKERYKEKFLHWVSKRESSSMFKDFAHNAQNKQAPRDYRKYDGSKRERDLLELEDPKRRRLDDSHSVVDKMKKEEELHRKNLQNAGVQLLDYGMD